MRSLQKFIVTPYGEEYSNTKSIAGEEFIVNTSLEDSKYVNRLGIVLSIPVNYSGDIKNGDVVVLHHNVFRIYFDMKGRQKKSAEFFRDGIYMVDPEKIYLYARSGESSWKSHLNYCFIRPITKEKQGELYEPTSEENHKGEVVYPSSSQVKIGIVSGDIIGFTKNSEYPFEINGEKLYRMHDRDVVVKFN